jgi:uncharacterized protein YkwD
MVAGVHNTPAPPVSSAGAPPAPGTGTRTTSNASTAAATLSQGTNTMGGGAGGAIQGASMAKGNELRDVLQGLVDVLKKLIDVVSKKAAGGHGAGAGGCCGKAVKGVTGGAAPVDFKPPTTSAPALNQKQEDHSFEQEVLRLINIERAKRNLGPVSYNAKLDLAAERHNAHQIRVNAMAHSGIGDGDPGARIRAAGFTEAWGENVATGQRTPAEVVQDWMNSTTHRANILNPNWTQMGVAYGQTASGRTYWAQEFGAPTR